MRPATSETRWYRIASIAAAIIALIAMAPVLVNGFTTWDDMHTIYENWRLVPPTWEGLAAHWTNEHMSLYVPITYTVWILVSGVSHLVTGDAHPAFFHAASLILHVLGSVFIFQLARTILESRSDARPVAIPALAGAVFFAAHPVQVESVAWASGLKDVLYGVLSVVALWRCVLAQSNWDDKPLRKRELILAAICFVLAMLAKPTAVVMPLMAVIVLRLVDMPWWRVAKIAGIGFVLAVPIALIARSVQPAHLAGVGGPVWARPLIAADAIAFYLGKLLAPFRLTNDYGRTPDQVIETGAIWWTWSFPVAVATIALLARRRAGLISAGLALAIIPILPVSGILPFEFQKYSTVSDHYLYLSMAGIALALTGAADLLQQARKLKPAVGILSFLLIIFIGLDWRQLATWRNSATLFTHTLSVNPQSTAAKNGLAIEAMKSGDSQNSLELLEQTLSENPNDYHALVNRGTALYRQGDVAGAEQSYRKAIEIWPNEPAALASLGGLLAEQGKAEEAIPLLQKALVIQPDMPTAQLNLGALHAMRGNYQEAEKHLRAAVRLAPRDPMAMTNLAVVLAERGYRTEAIALLERALEIDPSFERARNALASIKPASRR